MIYGVVFGKIRTQLIAYYGVLILTTMLASGILYQQLNRNLAVSKIGDLSSQTVYSIQFSLEALLDSFNKDSKRLIASATIQEILKDDPKESNSVETNLRFQRVVNEILIAEPSISSIYLFQTNGTRFSWENLKIGLTISDIRQAPWYGEVVKRDGGLIWRINAGGIMRKDGANSEFLSLIRMVNDLSTTKPLGLMIINIPMAEIQKSFRHTIQENQLYIMIRNQNEVLLPFADAALSGYANTSEYRGHPIGTFLKNLSGEDYLFAKTESEVWQYAIAMPVNDWTNPYGPINRVLLLLAILIFVLILLGSLWISRSISIPLSKMLDSMKHVQEGIYTRVVPKGASAEVRQLSDRYNQMIATIEQSILHEKESQKLRRKLELDILQQQIKPHFLYNSLESAGYLTLSGEKNKAYKLITALANYYRFSLSKGDEVVSFAREFEITRNYLVIQDMRYPDMFAATYELDENLAECQIPKLTLQPLVENALYHGIRPMGQKGEITITATRDGESACIVVRDDGMGMSLEKLEVIGDGRLETNSQSFGLRGTVSRLKLFYGDELRYAVDSVPGGGTAITLILPALTVPH